MNNMLIRPRDIFVVGRVMNKAKEHEYHFYGYREEDIPEAPNLRLCMMIAGVNNYSAYDLEYLGSRTEDLEALERHLSRNLNTRQLGTDHLYYRIESNVDGKAEFSPMRTVWPHSNWYFAFPDAESQAARYDPHVSMRWATWSEWASKEDAGRRISCKDMDVPF